MTLVGTSTSTTWISLRQFRRGMETLCSVSMGPMSAQISLRQFRRGMETRVLGRRLAVVLDDQSPTIPKRNGDAVEWLVLQVGLRSVSDNSEEEWRLARLTKYGG